MLKMNKCNVVHSMLSKEILHSNDYEAAHLPNRDTIRKAKQRQHEKQHRDTNPIFSILKMKKESMFFNCIGDVGADPFYCMFCIPEQKEFMRLSTRYKRCVLSIDATGAPVRPPPFSSLSEKTEKLKPVFLYVISLHVGKINKPVYQVLSQINTSDFIFHFLKCWRYQNDLKNPHEIIMDNECFIISLCSNVYNMFEYGKIFIPML